MNYQEDMMLLEFLLAFQFIYMSMASLMWAKNVVYCKLIINIYKFIAFLIFLIEI